MATSQAADGEHRVRRRRRSHNGLDEQKLYKSRSKERVTLDPDISEMRRIRVERLEGSTTTRRTAAIPKMTSESHAISPSLKSASSHRRRKEHRSPEDTKHRKHRKSSSKHDDLTQTYVYGAPAGRSQSSHVTIPETRKLGQDGESSESEEERATQSEPVKPKSVKRKTKIVYITEEESKSSKYKSRRATADTREPLNQPRDAGDSVHQSRANRFHKKSVAEPTSAPPPKRSLSTRDLPAEARPSLKRSNTRSTYTTTAKESYAPSLTSTNATNKRASFLSGFFGPAIQHQHHREPTRLVECLTCLSDDIPIYKSAKLKCDHRMCHSCLKRIFRLSVTDPQHMPPKCCTTDYIPLKHVERLFDINFKKLWNKKFQEYTTKNRIYCPARRCGEWIKPGSIHSEGGRKYGKCSRCKTKVCCICNGKWHGTKDCPKDEETNALLKAAKQAGWQRCYSCRTMVELKEGCNHMTCRCTAEFCMICGLKWKSCNCPWFNYEAVENDRLNHAQIPMPAEDQPGPEQRAPQHRRPRPRNHNEEIDQRRRQERQGEALAHRLQTVTLDDRDDDYQGGIGDTPGIGNGAGHFINQDYIHTAQNTLAGAFDQANDATANYVLGVNRERGIPPPGLQRRMNDRYPVAPPALARPPPPAPMLRRHTMREEWYNTAPMTRPSERVIPRRTRTDYESEAMIHAPMGRMLPRAAARELLRPSILAGLGGAGRGSGRVNAWRTHVEPGVTPVEGVLSM